MKNLLHTLWVGLLLSCGAAADFENWSNNEGVTARMKLLEVVKEGEKTTGKFELENGRTVSLEASTLSEESAKRLLEWKPPVEIKSVFDEMLDGNLVILNGRRFSKHEFEQKPEKFYVFYYTASWCPPCQKYTPDLVKFYEKARAKSNNFELILVTSDRDDKSMLDYAQKAKMPWPQIRFSKAREVRSKLNHGVSGIPSVIVCDLEGNVVSRSRDISSLERLLTK